MKVTIFSSLVEFFNNIADISILGRAIRDKIWQLYLVDLRKYGLGGYKQIDDTPYGGGSGMILRSDVAGAAIDDNFVRNPDIRQKFIVTSPRGYLFDQKIAEDWAKNVDELFILNNRFEGIDQRVINYYNIEEVSIGNYVLLGGEVASLVILEAVIRLLDYAVYNKDSLQEESFSAALDGMLEYDHYTKPAIWKDMLVPEVLQSGNHAKINNWRKENSAIKTSNRLKINS